MRALLAAFVLAMALASIAGCGVRGAPHPPHPEPAQFADAGR